MHSDRVERPAVAGRAGLLVSALFALGLAVPASAQQDTPDTTDSAAISAATTTTDSIVAASVNVGGSVASLELGLSDGRTVQLELAGGVIRADGSELGRYAENDGLDRSWRDLLEAAAMASTAELPAILRAWEPPTSGGDAARELDNRLEQALAGIGGRMPTTTKVVSTTPEDSIEELLERIEDLQAGMDESHEPWEARSAAEEFAHDVGEGIAGFFAALVWLGVLFGLGSALLFFGNGRLERLSQTVRDEPVRSGLIGLAGAFLAIPFYVLVIIALAISVLGIPLLVAWAPLFPMLVTLAGITGWLSVAYGAGDAIVTGKLSSRPSFQDAGMFKRMLIGVGLLLSPFFLAALFQMTSVLEWVAGLFFVIGIVITMLAMAVGFGAVLVRGRDALDRQRERRAAARRAKQAQRDATVTEGTNV